MLQKYRKKRKLEKMLLKQLEQLNYVLTKNHVLDLVDLLGNTKKLILRNIFTGIAKGIGIGIGVTIITAVIIYIMQKLIKLNIPVISKYISDIISIVENTKR